MTPGTWLAVLAGLFAVVGAVGLVVRRRKVAASPGADAAIGWMAQQRVRIRLDAEHDTTLAWAFHQLAREFEEGLTLSRWLTVVWTAEPLAPPPPGEVEKVRPRWLYELEERGLLVRLPHNLLREDQWVLSELGRRASRAIGRRLAAYAAPPRLTSEASHQSAGGVPQG